MRSNKVYQLFIVDALLATVFEITATHLARNMEVVGYPLFYFVLSLQTLFINFIPILFAYYVLLLANLNIRMGLWNIAFRIATAIDVAIIALNPFFHWAFTFKDEHYMIAPVGAIMYVIDVLMLTLAVVILIRFRKNFQFIKPMPLTFLFFCGVLSCIGQIVMYFPTLDLWIMAVALTLYHYQHNSNMVTDSVTGVFNRRFMGEYISNLFYDQKPFGVILMAMDDFKFINKTYGVETGDFLLCQAADFLETLEKKATVFRFNADQFCVVLNLQDDALTLAANKIYDRFHKPWKSEKDTDIMLSASICYLECPKDAPSYSALVEVLDYAMGETKRFRKGQVSKVSEIDIERARDEKAIEKAIQTALTNDTLMVFYQPIYSSEKGGYHSAEALVRLKDETLGWISPEIFIPIAEKNGFIIEMGERILTKVCRFIHDNQLEKTSIEFIEVNLSPIQLLQVQFAKRAKQIIEEYGIRPEQLNFEITETSAINSIPSVLDNINALLDYGICFSLDDYGSGYANINYINSMPFSIVKIDKDILWESFKNTKAAVTLEYTIAMLNALNLSIVAEGVETEEMQEKLTTFGCHYLQGWHFSKALPAEDFLKLIRKAG